MAEKQLTLHTSNRVENLAARLVEISQANPLAHLLSQESVMTLNPGIARWLQFEIAKRTGVSFGWNFPLPGKLFASVLRGFEPSFDATGAFPEDLARWKLLDVLDRLEEQPRFAVVRAYCRSANGTRRLAFASRLIRLYDEYLVYRPDVITRWEDQTSESSFDWQAEIWRRLVRSLYPKNLKPRHIARVWNDLGQGQILELGLQPDQWPERLFVFGVSSLAPLYLDLLDNLSRYRPVHIFLLQPSDLYWADLKSTKQIQKIIHKESKKRIGEQTTKPEDWLYETGNPLLPTLGKQSQMFLDLVIDKDPLQDDSSFEAPDEEVSQLACLQSDLFTIEDRDLASGSRPFPAYDGTLQIHSCSGRRREVETVWDQIVRRLDSEPDLKASEILVMAPDIQVYRSHIEAVFKAKRGTDLEIPFSIADNSVGSRPGVLSGLLAILQSVSNRATSAEVLALLETPLLREVFSFSDQDLERIEFWIRELGITWGWDASHRGNHDSFATNRNTWRELRSRLLSGMAFSEAVPIPGDFLAYAELEGELSDTAGRFVECLELVRDLCQDLKQTHSLSNWQSRLLTLLAALRSEREDWQRDYVSASELIRETLPDLNDSFITGLEAYRAVVEKLDSSVSGGGYLSGGVTFCSLKPMRAIPANTVCLMGMNRLDFPRRSNRLSFDLLAKETHIGDRNTRDEDRQFFLETLLSVRSHLFITYRGTAPNSDTKSEPSLVVEELLNYLSSAMLPEDFAAIQQKQKRQSFDPSYFDNELARTYDPDRAKLRNRFSGAIPFGDTRDDLEDSMTVSPEITDVDLDALIRFFCDPAKTFANSVAKLRIANSEDALAETDSLLSGGLDRYLLRESFAKQIVRGERLDANQLKSFAQQKLLPAGFLETLAFQEEFEKATQLASCLSDMDTRSDFFVLELDGVKLAGDSLIRESDGRQIIVQSGELKPKRLIDAWIRHLFASCVDPRFHGETDLVTLYTSGNGVRFGPVDGAKEILRDLLQAYRSGQSAPLPFFPELSFNCFKAWRDADADSEEERTQIAQQRARKDLSAGQSDSDYQRSFTWSAFDRICHGDHFDPDTRFVELAIAFWEPCEAAKSGLKLDELKGAGQ